MNVKCIRTTILAALALAGGAQAGTNVVHSFDTEGYRKKALDLIRRADVPSLQVTMTSPEGVLSETDPERYVWQKEYEQLAVYGFRKRGPQRNTPWSVRCNAAYSLRTSSEEFTKFLQWFLRGADPSRICS